MLLADPGPSSFDLNFRMLGTNVRVHPMFWLCSALLGWSFFQLEAEQLRLRNDMQLAVSEPTSEAAQRLQLRYDIFVSRLGLVDHERAAKIMREEMGAMGPVRLREVDEAQTYMVQMAKDLAARGEIVMADNKDDDELVY